MMAAMDCSSGISGTLCILGTLDILGTRAMVTWQHLGRSAEVGRYM
jgi:hypothetical protein